jgi:tetratricopeptide (TPR) repeat protein
LVVFKFMIIGRKHTKQAWLPRFIGESFERWTSADRASRLRELREAADAARDQHDWAAAVKLYGEVSAEDPSASDIAVQLGHAHKELGDYDRAGQLYYATLNRKPGDDDLHLQIGHLEKLRNNVAKAMEHYKKQRPTCDRRENISNRT